MNRNLYISPVCEYSKKMLIGLSRHNLLIYFNVINISKNINIPGYIRSVPCLDESGDGNNVITGERLFEYMNQFASRVLQSQPTNSPNQNLQSKNTSALSKQREQEDALDVDFEGWCKDDSCSIGFSSISDTNDDFKSKNHNFLESHFYIDNEKLTQDTKRDVMRKRAY